MVPVRVIIRNGPSCASYERIIEPSAKVMMDKKVSVGRTYVPAEIGIGCLLVTNFSSVPQWLNAGMTLASLEPAELISINPQSQEETTKSPAVGVADFKEKIGSELNDDESEKLLALLVNYADCFAKDNSTLGRCTFAEHSIDTADAAPIRQRPYNSAFKQREIIQKQVDQMIQDGVVEPTTGPWASPVVLARKPDNSWRFCVDFRRINALTHVPVYPLPKIEDALSRLEGSCWFSHLDLQAGFWQIPLKPGDKEKTGFITPDGHYRFNVMPFGLAGAPASFQSMMDVLLAGLKWNTCLVYLDDVVVYSATFEEHLERLEEVLIRIFAANLRFRIQKCQFLERILKLLGFIVSGEGILPDPQKISAVKNYPRPKSVKEIQSFIGLCSFFRRFIEDFSVIARPLSELTKRDRPFVWGPEQETSFVALKDRLTSPPLLSHPDYNLPFEIHPDASGYGIGAVILQQKDGVCHTISYVSRLLDKHEINYSITEKECLALVWSAMKFRLYIWGQKVKVVTDHHALCWLMTKKDLSGRLARWSLSLQDLDIQIVHRSGRLHTDADALSRFPVDPPDPPEAAAEDLQLYLIQLEKDPANVFQEQQRCRQLNEIIEVLSKENPDPFDVRRFKDFVFCNGQLHRRSIYNGQERLRLCIPPSLVNSILLACHDDPTAGHLGYQRTINKLRERFDWPGMESAVRVYIRTCDSCQRHKIPRLKPAGFLQPILTSEPFQNLGVDILGPFPVSEHQNRFIIVAVDYLTKWAITAALPDSKTERIVDFLIEKVVLQHGAPETLISDGARNLNSAIGKELLIALRTDHRVSTGYHPQSLGQVERLNHTLAGMLAMYVDEQHDDWDDQLPAVTFAYNTGRQETTGYSPFYLLYGRQPRLPIDVFLGSSLNNTASVTAAQYAETLINRLASAKRLLQNRTAIMQSKQKDRYDQGRRDVSYAIDDLVLVYKPIRKKGRAEKLLHHYFGPYKVIRCLSPLNYEVELLSKPGKKDVVHVCRMKPYQQRDPPLEKEPGARVQKESDQKLQEAARKPDKKEAGHLSGSGSKRSRHQELPSKSPIKKSGPKRQEAARRSDSEESDYISGSGSKKSRREHPQQSPLRPAHQHDLRSKKKIPIPPS